MLGFTKRKDVQRQDTIEGQVRVSTVKKDGPDFGDLKLSQCLQVRTRSQVSFAHLFSILDVILSIVFGRSFTHVSLSFPNPTFISQLGTRRAYLDDEV